MVIEIGSQYLMLTFSTLSKFCRLQKIWVNKERYPPKKSSNILRRAKGTMSIHRGVTSHKSVKNYILHVKHKQMMTESSIFISPNMMCTHILLTPFSFFSFFSQDRFLSPDHLCHQSVFENYLYFL